jgi:hypothetical protein
MTNGNRQGPDIGNGIDANELQDHLGEDLGAGTGGSSSGDTIGGKGDPEGGTFGGGDGTGPATLAAVTGGPAVEAAALGETPGALADAAAQAQAGPERLSGDPAGGETLGAGAARGDIGSGTPSDTGDLGGGGAEGSVSGTASPGEDSRR